MLVYGFNVINLWVAICGCTCDYYNVQRGATKKTDINTACRLFLDAKKFFIVLTQALSIIDSGEGDQWMLHYRVKDF